MEDVTALVSFGLENFLEVGSLSAVQNHNLGRRLYFSWLESQKVEILVASEKGSEKVRTEAVQHPKFRSRRNL